MSRVKLTKRQLHIAALSFGGRPLRPASRESEDLMSDEGHRAEVERFFESFNRRDLDGIRGLVHEDFAEEWPQSGERIRGLVNQQAVMANYPGLPDIEVKKVHGSEDRWLLTPSFTLMRVTGTGDQYTAEQLVHYPNGDRWHAVSIVEFRDGKIAKLTTYFASPFAPAEWRTQWVERMDAGDKSDRGY
jgi:ketosteroid isomerase-like protein